MAKVILVTGGAGFIGSALIRHLITNTDHTVINIDKLTYAGNLTSLEGISASSNYFFEQTDICDRQGIEAIFNKYQPDAIMHLAAESHVDRSIDGPSAFIETNIVGTYNLLECARKYWQTLEGDRKTNFRFQHISTDEVYGSLGEEGLFTEETPYDPRSPYSASKASSDHLVRAWMHTYGLPVLLTNCSNNYGPFHFPEKLVPLIILNCLAGKPLPVYGKGDNIRDWLYVDDHAKALTLVLNTGKVGETYNVGGNNERTNLEVVHTLCDILNELSSPAENGLQIDSYRELITFVTDRPGHDQRYAIDATKLTKELNWQPEDNFDTGIRKTVQWYLDNKSWWQKIQNEKYQGERLGQNK